MNGTDLSQMPLPDGLMPSEDAMAIISTFWLIVPTLPQMSYHELTEAFATYLYNNGLKIMELEEQDLQ